MSHEVRVYWPEGCAPYTPSVRLFEAETHIAARDSLADESALLACLYLNPDEAPLGWKKTGEGIDVEDKWYETYEYGE